VANQHQAKVLHTGSKRRRCLAERVLLIDQEPPQLCRPHVINMRARPRARVDPLEWWLPDHGLSHAMVDE
jgi:hypothetical protein